MTIGTYNYFIAVCEDNGVRVLIGDGVEDYYMQTQEVREDYYIADHLATGRIEICHRGIWRTVCRDSWTRADAAVACSQLGFSRAGIYLHR